MRVLGASVLVMESLTVGFAILLAIKDQSSMGILYGSILALALFATAGILKRRSGFYVGTVLQVFVIAFGLFVHHNQFLANGHAVFPSTQLL